MSLESEVTNLDSVPEALREHYTESNGKFVLSVQGMSPKSKVDEFRDTNLNLIKERDEQKAKLSSYGDVTPEEIQTMKAEISNFKSDSLVDKGEFDKALTEKTENLKLSYTDRINKKDEVIKNLQEENTKSSQQLKKYLIETNVAEAVNKAGKIRPGALRDIQRRAMDTWVIKDGVPVPQKADGSVIYGEDGNNPMGMEEWAVLLRKDSAYFFESNKGSGATGSDSGSMNIGGNEATKAGITIN